MGENLALDLLANLNKFATSSEGYLSGDHAQHTWGIEIPHLAFQWLIGGSNILPCQRFFGVSGEGKSFKSTLMTEIGNWFIRAGGVHILLDTEKKVSPAMLRALRWWNGIEEMQSGILKVCRSVDEWQVLTTRTIDNLRKRESPPKGSRQPVLIVIDSLTGSSTDDAIDNLVSEGAAADRGYPVVAGKITRYLEELSLLGTTVNVAWVQHMKKTLEGGGGYGGPEFKEKGATQASFSATTHLRVSRTATPVSRHRHDSAPYEVPVEGHELFLKSELSCVGPSKRQVAVELLWQYIDHPETGEPEQVMWFDWDGALGNLLIRMKYDDKFKPAVYKEDKARLDEAVYFVQQGKNVKCELLGLDEASPTAFGKAIRENVEVYDRVRKFLRIGEYPTVQTADIDWDCGAGPKKGKRR